MMQNQLSQPVTQPRFNYNILTFPQCQVIEEDHKRYYITPNNNKYISVTTFLNLEVNPHIEEWRQAIGPEQADAEVVRCAARGDAIHAIIEKYLRNIERPEEGYSKEYIIGFKLLKPRLNKINNILGLEAALYSDAMGLAGRCDCIGEYDGVLSIIDFKTSNRIKTKEMMLNYFLQTTAYALMMYELFGILPKQIVILTYAEKDKVGYPTIEKINKYIPLLHKKLDTYFGI